MQMQTLTIGLKNQYSPPGPNNPFEARLTVRWDNNNMQVQLSDETVRRLLELCADDIARAARVQMGDFVRDGLSALTGRTVEAAAIEAPK